MMLVMKSYAQLDEKGLCFALLKASIISNIKA